MAVVDVLVVVVVVGVFVVVDGDDVNDDNGDTFTGVVELAFGY